MSDFKEIWEIFFKPEARSGGRKYVAAENVSVSHPSETEIVGYIRGTSAFKVSLKTDSIESADLNADCNCPISKKGQLCKHIWAVLLKTYEKYPDFFESKRNIEKRSGTDAASPQKKPSFSFTRPEPKPPSQAQLDSQAAYKAKQADYRKQMYQKQKMRLKERKQANKKVAAQPAGPSLPIEVQNAVTFFSVNGFEFEAPFNVEVLGLAKKRLSRIFHPDVGGAHDEILELNRNFEVLIAYLKNENVD